MADLPSKDEAKAIADRFFKRKEFTIAKEVGVPEEIPTKKVNRELLVTAITNSEVVNKLGEFDTARRKHLDSFLKILEKTDQIMLAKGGTGTKIERITDRGEFKGIRVLNGNGASHIISADLPGGIAKSYEDTYQKMQAAGNGLKRKISSLTRDRKDVDAVMDAMIYLSRDELKKYVSYEQGNTEKPSLDQVAAAMRTAVNDYNTGTVIKKPELKPGSRGQGA